MPSAHYPHITFNARSVPCIEGTRHRVVDIAADYLAHGYGAAQIVEQYPDLTLAQVHAAFTYYFDHREEIEAALIASYRDAEHQRKGQPRHPKLRAALADPVA